MHLSMAINLEINDFTQNVFNVQQQNTINKEFYDFGTKCTTKKN